MSNVTVQETPKDERPVIRCASCGLTQYAGRSKCPRCYKGFPKVHKPEPEPEPVAAKGHIPLEQFGVRLRQLRKASHMGQVELGLAAHTSRPNISLIESSKRLPGLVLLENFSEALGCEVADLLKSGPHQDMFYAQARMLCKHLTSKQRQEVLVVVEQLSRLVVRKEALN